MLGSLRTNVLYCNLEVNYDIALHLFAMAEIPVAYRILCLSHNNIFVDKTVFVDAYNSFFC